LRSVSLVAGDHVLRDALQTDDCVGGQRRTPPPAAVPAKVPGRGNGADAFHGCDGVSANDRGMCSVKISRLDFDIADAFFPSEPILAREECGVGIRKRATGGNYGEAEELCVDHPGLGRPQGGDQLWGRDRGALHCNGTTGCVGKFFGRRDRDARVHGHQHGDGGNHNGLQS
jgi:hypothetical protein